MDNIKKGISKFKNIVKWERFLYYFNYKIPQEIYISWDIKADTSRWQ